MVLPIGFIGLTRGERSGLLFLVLVSLGVLPDDI